MLHRGPFFLGVMVVAVLLGLARVTGAGPAADQLRPEIERVVTILQDPALAGDRRTEERRYALRAATESVFDWTEMAKRSLGRHWAQRTEGEQQEFVELFRGLIERAYLGKIETYSGERILYVGETTDGALATVRTKLVSKQNQGIPIDYRMVRHADRWRIYDVIIEGVGLVNNYRSQFDSVIRASSYEELVKRMRSRATLATAAGGGA